MKLRAKYKFDIKKKHFKGSYVINIGDEFKTTIIGNEEKGEFVIGIYDKKIGFIRIPLSCKDFFEEIE